MTAAERDTVPVDLDALERLRAEATPGEWTADYEDGWIHVGKSEIACVGDSDFPEHVDTNAALIVTAVNALPALIAELRAARQDAARWRQTEPLVTRVYSIVDTWNADLSFIKHPLTELVAIAKGGPT